MAAAPPGSLGQFDHSNNVSRFEGLMRSADRSFLPLRFIPDMAPRPFMLRYRLFDKGEDTGVCLDVSDVRWAVLDDNQTVVASGDMWELLESPRWKVSPIGEAIRCYEKKKGAEKPASQVGRRRIIL